MKKIVLILCGIVCVCGNVFAARDGGGSEDVVFFKIDCPKGCEYVEFENKETGTFSFGCVDKNGSGCENMSVKELGGQNQVKIEKIDQAQAVSGRPVKNRARSAKMMVPQKIIYKEIIFDDSVDLSDVMEY